MKQILCVTDLTESAGHVLMKAAKIANENTSRLTVLFPYRLIPREYTGDISQLKIKLEQEAKEKFLALRGQLPLFDSIVYEFLPEIGFPGDRVNAYIKRNKVESVVIGQHQANLKNELTSMNLQNLLADSKLPVVIVPEDTSAEVLNE